MFEGGGPYTDLYSAHAIDAKRDPRLKESGSLVGFQFDDLRIGLEPMTAFYDWLYLTALFPHREWLARLHQYSGFTDIEFNPSRSVNCQARACALFVALLRNGGLVDAMASPASFVAYLLRHTYRPQLRVGSIATDQLDAGGVEQTRSLAVLGKSAR